MFLTRPVDVERIRGILSRREIIFLHVSKSAGSSFWHALANQLNMTGEFGVDDAFGRAYELYGVSARQPDAINFILGNFNKTDLKQLIVHYHSKLREIGRPSDILPEAGYLTLLRDPEARMCSGFRHWYTILSEEKSGNVDVYAFFEHWFSFGANRIIPYVLGFDEKLDFPDDGFVNYFNHNVIGIDLDEYISGADSLRILCDAFRISAIPCVHLEETKTNILLDRVLEDAKNYNVAFYSRWCEEVERETAWLKVLLDV